MVAQVGAKLGFVPWTIDELPFADLPTMILGLDASGSVTKKSKQVLSITATSDPNFSQYWSLSEFYQDQDSIGKLIYQALGQAMQNFYDKNGCYPMRLIFFREGVSNGQ